MPIPEWLAAALVAAALATLGFVGKQILEFIVSIRTAARMRRARLVTLLSLLTGTAAVFRVQTVLSRRLCHLMTNRDPTLGKLRGYEAIFAAAFPKITPEERELHSIIRGYTINGIKPLNESMIEWLKADTEFKLPRSRRGPRRELARLLSELEAHLLMWLAKYSAWIPETPSHALVFLADEERHGVPFPWGIEGTIANVLRIPRPAASMALPPTVSDYGLRSEEEASNA
jgi:hypothetical protein